jgi:hypothetical protein
VSESSTSSEKKTKVSIAILEARGLASKDRNGLSDPYCEVRLVIDGKKEDPKYDTRTVEKTLSPVWKERFVFINENLAKKNAQIVVKCFDANRFAGAKFLGIVHLSLHDLLDALPRDGVWEKWLPLQAYKGDIDISGDLHVQLCWNELPLERLDRSEVLSPEDQARVDKNKQLELQQLRRLRGDDDGIKPVTETIKNLTNIGVVNDATAALKNIGSTVGNAVAPIVPKQLRRSTKDAADAADDAAAAQAAASQAAAAEALRQTLADDDAEAAAFAAANGGAQRPLYYFVSQVLTEPLAAAPLDDVDKLQAEVEAALNVSQFGKLASALQRPRTTVSLLRNLLYRLYTLETHPVYAKGEWQHKKQYFAHLERQRDTLRECIRALVFPTSNFSGKLSIDVLEAQELPALDSNGLSDPYVLLQLGNETAKTKTQMRTLTPKWKNEKHVLNANSLKAALEVSLWDWDTTSEDDFMGNVVIPLTELLDGNEVNKWYKLSTGTGSVHLAVQLKYPYVEYWRAIDADSELRNCGLGGLADGQLASLPSAVDLLLDCTGHVTELLEALLLQKTPERVSVNADADLFRRVQWLVDAYGDRFSVPLGRRRLELLRLLVRAGNNNKLIGADVDPFVLPKPAAAAAPPAVGETPAAPAIWSNNAAVLTAFMTIAADPVGVKAAPVVLLLEQAHNAVCDVRRQVAHSLTALSGRELAWDKQLAARLPVEAALATVDADGKELAPPSALTRAELALFKQLEVAFAHQRFAVLRRFKVHYSLKSPTGSLSANVEALREMIDKDALYPLLREAVLAAVALYHTECAPAELTTTIVGITAMHTVVRQELEEDDVYALSFPREFGYIDATTAYYIAEYRKSFELFCEKCPYESAVFTVWEEARELKKTLHKRLSADAAARLPTFDMVKLFEPFIFGWLKESATRLDRWTARAVEIDPREPAHEDVTYSVGVIDAFSGCEQAYQHLKSLGLDTPFVNCQFAEVVCNVMRNYVDLEADVFCDLVDGVDGVATGKQASSADAKKALAEERSKRGNFNPLTQSMQSQSARVATTSSERLKKLLHVDSDKSKPVAPFAVTTELCVSLCNVEEARYKLDELLSSFGDVVETITKRVAAPPAAAPASGGAKAGAAAGAAAAAAAAPKSFEDQMQKAERAARDRQVQEILAESFEALSRSTFSHLSARRDDLVNLLGAKACRYPVSVVGKLRAGDTFNIQPICDYFDQQWQVMVSALRAPTFGALQDAAWAALLTAMEERLLANVRCISEASLDGLIDYFHGGGEGMPKAQLEDKAATVRRLIKYNEMTTYQLIKVYYACKRATDPNAAAAAASASAAVTTSTTDLTAAALADAAAADSPLGLPAGASAEERTLALTQNMGFTIALLQVRARYCGKEGTPEADDKEADAFIKEYEAAERKAKKQPSKPAPAMPSGNASPSQAVVGAVAASVQAAPVPQTKEDKLRHKFMLPPSEMFLEDFTCRFPALPGTLGTLRVTTSHVCYAVRWGDDDDESTKDTLVFDMDNIVSMRVKTGLLAGHLYITAFNTAGIAVEHTFDRFPHAKKCQALIVDRAKLLQHDIEIIE